MTEQWSRLARVRALVDLKRSEEAVVAAREAVRAEPGDPEALCHLAMALADTDPVSAVAVAEDALAMAPENAWAQRLRGWALHRAGFEAAAIDQLQAAIAAEPGDSSARVMFVNVATSSDLPKSMQRARLSQARTYLDEAVRAHPNDATVYFAQARLDLVDEDAARAETSARQGLALEPAHPVGHQLLGMAAQMQGRARAAGDHFVSAGRLDPRSSASTELLRSLRKVGPLGRVAFVLMLWISVRIARQGVRSDQVVLVVIAVTFVLGLLVYQLVLPRLKSRLDLSDDARTALDRDRILRSPRRWKRRR